MPTYAPTYASKARLLSPLYDPRAPRVKPPSLTGAGTTAAVAPPGGGAPPGSGGSPPPVAGHWNSPDYAALLAADPTLLATNASTAADEATAALQRQAAVRRAVFDVGLRPTQFSDQYGDLDPATLAAAQANPMSQAAQLATQRDRSRADLANALGIRGILSSGALTGGEQRVQENYTQGTSAATQKLLDALAGYGGNYASTIHEMEMRRLAEQEAAAGRISQAYLPQWVTGDAAPQTNAGADVSGDNAFVQRAVQIGGTVNGNLVTLPDGTSYDRNTLQKVGIGIEQ